MESVPFQLPYGWNSNYGFRALRAPVPMAIVGAQLYLIDSSGLINMVAIGQLGPASRRLVGGAGEGGRGRGIAALLRVRTARCGLAVGTALLPDGRWNGTAF